MNVEGLQQAVFIWKGFSGSLQTLTSNLNGIDTTELSANGTLVVKHLLCTFTLFVKH